MKKSYQKTLRRGPEGIHYKHDLGQNFLYDEALLNRLVESTGVGPQDGVLEIGPGAGTLTKALLKHCGRVVAVEADHDILPFLRAAVGTDPRLTIVEGDIRKVNLREICAPLGENFHVIANIPYSITQTILLMLWESGLPIRQICVMVQKEVAQKLLAQPGEEDYALLSLKCAYYTRPEWLETVPAEAFTPPPKVDSAFVRMETRREPPAPVKDEKLLWRIIRDAFNQRRKTLVNALKGTVDTPRLQAVLREMDLSPTVRGETLTVEQWIDLSNRLTECREASGKEDDRP